MHVSIPVSGDGKLSVYVTKSTSHPDNPLQPSKHSMKSIKANAETTDALSQLAT